MSRNLDWGGTVRALPPGPEQPPALQLYRWMRKPIELLDECARRYGDTFTLRFPLMPPFVLFSDPAAIRDLFTADPEVLRAGEANSILKSIVGERSLLLLDGDKHLHERRLMMPPFHGERMRAYGETMREVTLRAIDRWPRGQASPIHGETQAITLDVILETVFGLTEGARLNRMRDLLVRFTTLGTSKLGTALLLLVPPEYSQVVKDIASRPMRIAGLPLNLAPLVPWRELVRVGIEVDELLFAEFAERRRRGSAAAGDDVLSMMMEATDEAGRRFDDVALRDEMLTLLLAGHETSATTLAWTVLRILEHPEVLAEIEAELARVTGGRPPSPEEVGALSYLEATIKESLRMVPIVAVVGRRVARPTRIGGVELPAGVNAIGCISLAHRRAAAWPDPTRFDPTRFLGKKIDPYQFFPFGGGTRRCLGMAFATYEMKMVLATILSRVTLRAAPGMGTRLVRRGITFAPADGVPVVVEERRG